MNPNRVDFLIDLAYGVLLFFSIVLIVYVGTGIGIAFGLGALVSYVIHVGWKMARFDPQWMTEEVAENIEETITEEVTESVGEKVTEEVTEEVTESVGEKVTREVTENVEEQVAQEVTESVEATLSEDIDSIIDRLEEVNERIDRRPRTEEVEKRVAETAEAREDDDRDEGTRANGGR
jgi:divalent metal cation (Fe/Co/Zn/Cd) transporter